MDERPNPQRHTYYNASYLITKLLDGQLLNRILTPRMTTTGSIANRLQLGAWGQHGADLLSYLYTCFDVLCMTGSYRLRYTLAIALYKVPLDRNGWIRIFTGEV